MLRLTQRLTLHCTQLLDSLDDVNQLTRQFWVTRDDAKANKYDLSASRYRQVEQDDELYEQPHITLSRLLTLEKAAAAKITELEGLLK